MTNIGYTTTDLSNLAKYITGASINEAGLDLGAGMAGYFIFDGAIKGGSYLHRNWNNFKNKGLLKTLGSSIKTQGDLEKSLKGKNIWETTQNHYKYNTLKELGSKYRAFTELSPAELAKLDAKAQAKYMQNLTKSNYYNDVRKLLSEAEKLSGKAYNAKMKQVYEAIAKAELNVHNAKLGGELAPLSKTGKAVQKAKQVTGITKASTATKTLAASSSTVRTLSKAVKGNALFAGISLLAAAPEVCETYSTLGAEKGTKQVARTVGNVAAETAGFVVGMKAGAAAGAAIGSCIPIPVVGTAVGAIVGAAAGFVGSWLAGKGARALLGKSELEQHKEYNANVLALRAKFDQQTEQQLLLATKSKLDQEQNSENPDAITAMQSYEKVLASYA